MNIIFETLEVQNFKSIGELIVFNYTDFSGLNFIIGTNKDQPGSKNGAGKSALAIDALVFALFGRTLKNTNNVYIPNRTCNKKLETFSKVTFTIDGQRYRSEAYIKNGTTVKMLLYKEDKTAEDGWEDLTQCSVIKTRQYIQESVLKCTFDIFKTSVIIAASDCINFYEGMNKNQKRNYIDNLFNLIVFGDMFSDIKNNINDTKKELSFVNNEIVKNTKYVDDLNKKYEEYNKSLTTATNDLKQEIIDKAGEYNKLLADKQAIADKLEEFKPIEAELLVKTGELKTETDNKSKAEKEIYKATCKINSIKKSMEEFEIIKGDLCQDCLAKISKNETYCYQQRAIQALDKYIKDFSEKKDAAEANISNLNVVINELKNKLNDKNRLTNEYNLIVFQCNKAKDDVLKLKADFAKNKENNKNPFGDLLNSAKTELSDQKNQVGNFNYNLQHLDIMKDICSENGVKRHIIKDIVSMLNSLIQKYLNEIGGEFVVYFDETFDFKFMTMNGECEYSNFSAGEKQRIQIATMLALSDLISHGKLNSNIYIIDEMLDQAVDSNAIKRITAILQRKSEETNRTTFVISHRSEITEDNIFNNIIEISKENGVSTMNVY